MPASLDLIGRGWAFPLGVDARGGIALAEGDEEIRQAILLIVRTRRGARVMRPEFGCRVWELLFAPNDSSTWTLAGHHVREALGWWEPRIEVDDVRAAADPGNPAAVEIEVDYTIRGHPRPAQPRLPVLPDPRRAGRRRGQGRRDRRGDGRARQRAGQGPGPPPAPSRPQVATGRAPSPTSDQLAPPPDPRRPRDDPARPAARRPHVPGPRRRGEAAHPDPRPGVDRPQRERSRGGAHRAVRVHDRPAPVPAQPRARPPLRQVPRAHRAAHVPAGAGPDRHDVLALRPGQVGQRRSRPAWRSRPPAARARRRSCSGSRAG